MKHQQFISNAFGLAQTTTRILAGSLQAIVFLGSLIALTGFESSQSQAISAKPHEQPALVQIDSSSNQQTSSY